MKEKKKIRLALLWHMHQPVYGLPGEREFRLPWVRMHALRGYLWLARLAARYPKIRQTFNLVPSLLSQVEAYGNGYTDTVERLARLDASSLGEAEKHLIIEHFFSINPRHHILPYPRYRQLLEESRREKGRWAISHWQTQEWCDLQVWFHLSSLDPISKTDHPLASKMIRKGKRFTETEKIALLEFYRQSLAEIIPTYRKLWEDGLIEISTTPFYHPILPILCDARIGRTANPSLPDYDLSFRWPRDAEMQISRALEAMENWFGRRPSGMWPSEGSISEEVIGIMDRLGITWCASDEAVLEKSWRADGQGAQPLQRNRPYHLPSSQLAIFFRNHDLSDRLGFSYQNLNAEEAADDFIAALLGIAPQGYRSPLISVILDGENPWEHYPRGGRDFLETLFSRLGDHPQIETVTFSSCTKDAALLSKLLPGSWINGNFDIWIGDVQDRNAWRLVAETRTRFDEKKDELDDETVQQITELLFRAEGSDWTWWYGSEHHTKDLLIFDGLLRDHLLEAYRLMGEDPPQTVLHPVAGGQRNEDAAVLERQSRFLAPDITLRPIPFFEWLGSGRIEARGGGGSMHQVSGNNLVVEFGYSEQMALYLRCPLPQNFEGTASLRAETGDRQLEASARDIVIAEKEFTARMDFGPTPVTDPLTVQIELGQRRFVFMLPPPDKRQLKSNWMV